MNSQQKQQVAGLVPEPHNQVYTGRDAVEDRLITTLMLAGEAVAQVSEPMAAIDAPHALPKEVIRPAFFDDFEGLLAILRQIDSWVAADPRRAELMTQLRTAFGDGDALRLLFRRYYPEQVTPKVVDADKKVVLSDRDVEVLRAAAADRSHEEIAQHLGIAPRTVNRHLENIYRKLGVHRPMQAVARAIAMGFLDMDVIRFVDQAAKCSLRQFTAFDTLLAHASGTGSRIKDMKGYAEFGLLLMALAGMTAMVRHSVNIASQAPGIVCELDAEGRIARSLGEGYLGRPRSLAVAPPLAANHGFTPGHLYIVHDRLPRQGLNDGEIAEFSPDGRFIRAFYGGKEIGTRLTDNSSLAFTADGRLLVTSGWLTDTILAFSEGGAAVRQFAHCGSSQVCVDAAGKVYASQRSGIGCIVKVFDANGTLLQTIGGTPPGVYYGGIAISSDGELFVAREDGMEAAIEVYNQGGSHLRTFDAHGYNMPDVNSAPIAIDARNRLAVPCRRTGDIKIFSSEGTLLKRIDLGGKIVPYAVAFGEEGRMWISGVLTS